MGSKRRGHVINYKKFLGRFVIGIGRGLFMKMGGERSDPLSSWPLFWEKAFPENREGR